VRTVDYRRCWKSLAAIVSARKTRAVRFLLVAPGMHPTMRWRCSVSWHQRPRRVWSSVALQFGYRIMRIDFSSNLANVDREVSVHTLMHGPGLAASYRF